QNKQGEEFDQAFMALQVLGHMQMSDTLEVLQTETSGQLQQIIQQAHQSVQQHLQEAQQIHDQLQGSSSGNQGAGRQPGDRPETRPGLDRPTSSDRIEP